MSFSIRRDVIYDDVNAENINVENNGNFRGDIAIRGGDIASTATDFNLLRFDTVEGTGAGPATITLGDTDSAVSIPGALAASIISNSGFSQAPSIEFLGAATLLPPSGTKLDKNTYYENDWNSTDAFLLPTRDDSVAGDWIKYRKIDAEITTGQSMTFGSAANGFLAINSRITGLNALSAGTLAITTEESTGSHNSIIMMGKSNGSGGQGSEITFVFNGTAWVGSGLSVNQGSGINKTVGDVDVTRFAAT